MNKEIPVKSITYIDNSKFYNISVCAVLSDNRVRADPLMIKRDGTEGANLIPLSYNKKLSETDNKITCHGKSGGKSFTAFAYGYISSVFYKSIKKILERYVSNIGNYSDN